MRTFDRLSQRLGAFFSRGHVFAAWIIGNILWLIWFPFVSPHLAKSDLSDRLNFWQLPWLTLINIFTLFYAIWISNNQIRGNKSNDQKFNLLADALAKHMEASAQSMTDEEAEKLRVAASELREAIGKEQEVST